MIIIIALLLAGIVLLQIYNNIRLKKLSEEKGKLEQVVSFDKAQYAELVNSNWKLRQINHDLQKYLQVVEMVTGDDKQGEVSLDYLIKRIVQDKETEALMHGIRFEKRISDNIPWKLNAGDLIRLFVNLTDNAIEAAKRVVAGAFIIVDISYSESTDVIEVTVKNSKIKEEIPLEKGMHTTKTDTENHGYGVGIIKEIAGSHKGCVTMEDKGSFFVTNIRF